MHRSLQIELFYVFFKTNNAWTHQSSSPIQGVNVTVYLHACQSENPLTGRKLAKISGH